MANKPLDLATLAARLEQLEQENARLRAGSGKVPTFEQSPNNPKYWVFKTGKRGYPVSATAEMWRDILANVKLIEASIED